jgi:hypothetical protein
MIEPWPWGRPCDSKLFGADIVIKLFRPISVDDDFPYSEYRDGSSARYFEGVVDIKASNVRVLHVSVDVLRNRVVGIDPTDSDDEDVHIARFRDAKPFVPGPVDGC